MSDAVNQIKEKLSILDVVAPYVELHKAGKNYKGKSPFTQEKTPSFFVSPDEGLYYCFSSNQGGDIFSFVEKMEGVDFKGALRILAEKAGVSLERENKQLKDVRDLIYSINEEATRFYEGQLENMPDVRALLHERGLKDSTIAKWRLGYAPGPPQGGWRELLTHLLEKNFSTSDIRTAGLIKSSDGKEPYDVFRDRIIFPIKDASGRVVAFSGRIFHVSEKAPKYVNSPETELYKKSEILFGYDSAKHGIRHYDFSLIVEGQFDLVLSHQAGYTNAVAVSGTALSEQHVTLLQRLSDRVVLALDSDSAGINAIKKAAIIMLKRGMDVKVAQMPEGSDPADILAKESIKVFKTYIREAKHVIEFLLSVIKDRSSDDRTYKLKVGEEVLPYILLIPNKIDREYFEERIAEAIRTTKEAVHHEVERLEQLAEREGEREVIDSTLIQQEEKDSLDIELEKKTTRSDGLMAYLAVASVYIDEKYKPVCTELFTAVVGKSPEVIINSLSRNERSKLVFTTQEKFEGLSDFATREELRHSFEDLKDTLIKALIAQKRVSLRNAEKEGDEAGAHSLLEEIDKLQKRLSEAITKNTKLSPEYEKD